MAAVPSSRTWVAGEIVTAAYMNNTIRDVENYLLAPPLFLGRQTVAQTLTTGTFTAVTFDAEDVDSAGGHSTSVNTSRYTAQYTGWYWPGGGVGFAANTTGRRNSEWRTNGATVISGSGFYASANAGAGNVVKIGTISLPIFLNATTDYLEMLALQDSGGNLNTAVGGINDQSCFSLKWCSN